MLNLETCNDITEIVRLEETTSTNSVILSYEWKEENKPIKIIRTEYQTSGRGQRGASWESSKGKNLLYSILVRPIFLRADEQFYISIVQSLALQRALTGYVSSVTIKWPNDIYHRDSKISGTLITHELAGDHLSQSVIGTGVNVNQAAFESDAPNPISLRNILGHEIDKEQLFSALIREFIYFYQLLQNGQKDLLHQTYMQLLYRAEGYYLYQDAEHVFEARIVGISPLGRITLLSRHGEQKAYAFKEVSVVLPSSL